MLKVKVVVIYLIVVLAAIDAQDVLDYDDDGPCGRWRPGDADLDTFDIIREFHLDRFESRYESVTRVEGSKVLQTAYHLEEKANLTMRSQDAFPRGVPHEFSFECSYRAKQKQQEPWHLFLLTNSFEESQLSLTMNPESETLSLSLPDVNGDLQMVEYRSSSLFDKNWHKIMMGVTDNHAKLWVDCRPVKSVQGFLEAPLEHRGEYDVGNGFLSVAQMKNSQMNQHSSPAIDLQWMVMTCDPTRPDRQTCDEIPEYDVAGVSDKQPMGPPPTCPVICPQGPQGLEGPPGKTGMTGEKGAAGERLVITKDGQPGLPGPIGLRGERGPPGPPGDPAPEYLERPSPEYAQPPGLSEDEIRDIIEIVLREKLAKLAPSLRGPQGPRGPPGIATTDSSRLSVTGLPGLPGHKGAQGENGEKGERGEDGAPGPIGPRGFPGNAGRNGQDGIDAQDGIDGRNGIPGERGDRGPQGEPGSCPSNCLHALSHLNAMNMQYSRQQNKGPSR